MGIDATVDRLEIGDEVMVTGKRTETQGRYLGVGLNEQNKPRILIGVQGCPINFAYEFSEVNSIEKLDDTIPQGREVDMVEQTYDEDVLNANAGGHSGSGVKSRFGS